MMYRFKWLFEKHKITNKDLEELFQLFRSIRHEKPINEYARLVKDLKTLHDLIEAYVCLTIELYKNNVVVDDLLTEYVVAIAHEYVGDKVDYKKLMNVFDFLQWVRRYNPQKVIEVFDFLEDNEVDVSKLVELHNISKKITYNYGYNSAYEEFEKLYDQLPEWVSYWKLVRIEMAGEILEDSIIFKCLMNYFPEEILKTLHKMYYDVKRLRKLYRIRNELPSYGNKGKDIVQAYIILEEINRDALDDDENTDLENAISMIESILF